MYEIQRVLIDPLMCDVDMLGGGVQLRINGKSYARHNRPISPASHVCKHTVSTKQSDSGMNLIVVNGHTT